MNLQNHLNLIIKYMVIAFLSFIGLCIIIFVGNILSYIATIINSLGSPVKELMITEMFFIGITLFLSFALAAKKVLQYLSNKKLLYDNEPKEKKLKVEPRTKEVNEKTVKPKQKEKDDPKKNKEEEKETTKNEEKEENKEPKKEVNNQEDWV